MATAPDKVLGMSDDEFANLPIPGDAPVVADPAASGAEAAPEKTTEEPTKDPVDGGEPEKVAEEPVKDPKDEPKAEPEKNPDGTDKVADPELNPDGSKKELTDEEKAAAAEAAKAKPGGEPDGGDKSKDEAPKSSTAVAAPKGADLEQSALVTFYDTIMAPLKANGKTIELRSPEEAVALMQMGANYTKKLQDLRPARKVLTMLESNGMMDEGKLSFAIDLIEKKDPEAIKKLLKDAGINPLEIDADTDPAYVEGSHRVSDEQVNFHSTLDELSSNPAGVETITEINTSWDQASKQALWAAPEIMTVIHQQREAGIYDVVKAEVDRRITLGSIPATTPFIEAYKTVGDEMAQAAITAGGGGKDPTGAATDPTKSPTGGTVVATRTETPKSPVANGDKASAASPTRSSPAPTGDKPNPLAMSDEDFLKNFQNRL